MPEAYTTDAAKSAALALAPRAINAAVIIVKLK